MARGRWCVRAGCARFCGFVCAWGGAIVLVVRRREKLMANSKLRQRLPGSMGLDRPVQVPQRHQIQRQMRLVKPAEMMMLGAGLRPAHTDTKAEANRTANSRSKAPA